MYRQDCRTEGHCNAYLQAIRIVSVHNEVATYSTPALADTIRMSLVQVPQPPAGRLCYNWQQDRQGKGNKIDTRRRSTVRGTLAAGRRTALATLANRRRAATRRFHEASQENDRHGGWYLEKPCGLQVVAVFLHDPDHDTAFRAKRTGVANACS